MNIQQYNIKEYLLDLFIELNIGLQLRVYNRNIYLNRSIFTQVILIVMVVLRALKILIRLLFFTITIWLTLHYDLNIKFNYTDF